METTQLNVEIPKDLHRRLKAYAAMAGTPMLTIILVLIENHLNEVDNDKA